MDFIFRLSDEINDFNGSVEVIQLSNSFKNQAASLQSMLKIEDRLVEGSYNITLEDLLSCIDRSAVLGIESETPILPNNCLKHVWINRVIRHQIVYIEVPKQRWDITYNNNVKFEQVGFPRLVFKYELKGKFVKLLNVFALKNDGFVKKDSQGYYFPFSHVSTDGHVCMGTNTFPEIHETYQLSTLHLLFLNAPFGNDYGAKTTTGKTIEQLFSSLTQQDFNDDWLLPSKQFEAL